MKFGDKLIALRKKKGMSQEDLAEKLGVSRQSVSKWESNNTYPETDKIVQICNIFDCSMDDLINENIETIENIERKNKNNLNVVFDSFLEFITKTINMFGDMKFTSGLRCVIEMFIIFIILFIIGMIIVTFTDYVISDLFAFMPYTMGVVFCKIIKSIIIILLVIVSIIILIHVFKIRYLDYYDKVSLEKANKVSEEQIKQKNNKEKINFEKKEKIIIRDEKHRPFAFLSVLSRIIIIFIKIMLIFFMVGLLISLLIFVVLFIVSISLIPTHAIFIGSTIALISSILINIILLLMVINFIFDKKSNYKIMLIIFISSVIMCGVGIGISTISLKNIEIKEGNAKTTTKEETIKYDDDMYFTNDYYLDNIEYIIDNNLKNDVKVIIKYDNRFCSYFLNSTNTYNLKEINIEPYSNTNVFKVYKEVTKDLKNNIIRDYKNIDEFNMIVVSSKENIDKMIDNTKKIYFVDITNTENGYSLSNFENRIAIYGECYIEYDAKTNKPMTNVKGCTCNTEYAKTERGDAINYSCNYN